MDRTMRVIDSTCQWGGRVAIVSMWSMVALIMAEIIARNFFNATIPGNLEFSGWLLVAMTFMGIAWTLKDKGHVQIDMFTSRMSKRYQYYLMVVLAMVGAIVTGFIALNVGRGVIDLYVNEIKGESVIRLPVWWAWTPFFIGMVLMTLQHIPVLAENLHAARTAPKNETGVSPKWLLAVEGLFFGIAILLFFSLGPSEMSPWLILLFLFGVVLCLVFSSLWIFMSLTLAGILGIIIFTKYPIGLMIPKQFFNSNASFTLTSLPLFILMGEILVRSGVTERLYSSLVKLVGRLPGGLLHSNILACSIFAAISGSSAATCATVATVAVPELKKLGYERGISVASLAGAGTLGILIPPSIPMIIYGSACAESIGQLFLAGIIPGLMVAGLYMSYIGILAIVRPSIAPIAKSYPIREKLKAVAGIGPAAVVIGLVLGLIYLGISTPTEAAAIGVVGSLGLSLINKNLTWKNFNEASWDALRTSCMIMLIVASASLLSTCFGYLRVPQYVAATVQALGISKWMLFTVICCIYLILGCFFEGISMMLLTLPIVYPVIKAVGFDGIWFGIVLVILIEVGLVTPPVGMNLYVMTNLSGESIMFISKEVMPFLLLMCLAILLLALFPQIAMFLPSLMTPTS
jgi:C4-dicarboxylate transporter, DctM subunit